MDICYGSASIEFSLASAEWNVDLVIITAATRHYAASRKVAGSSPDEVDFFKLT
jgi:hypothetical protein